MKDLIENLIKISKRDYKFHWWNSSREIIMYYILSKPVKEFHQQGMYSEKEVYDLCYSAMKQMGYTTLYDLNVWWAKHKK